MQKYRIIILTTPFSLQDDRLYISIEEAKKAADEKYPRDLVLIHEWDHKLEEIGFFSPFKYNAVAQRLPNESQWLDVEF